MLHLVRRGAPSLLAAPGRRRLLRARRPSQSGAARFARAASIPQLVGGARRSVYRGSNRFRRERSNLKNPYREASRSDSLESFSRPLDAYLRLLEKHPLATKALTSMFIVGVGDVGCQAVLGEEDAAFDWKRFATFTFLGGALVGPALHFWYGFLNRIVPGVGTAAALKRLAIDQTVFAASFIPIFMTSAMVLEGNELSSIPPAIKREWFPALLANWGLWIPGNFVNFRFVAPRLQVLFANVVALGWNAYLSWASHRGPDGGSAGAGGGADEVANKTTPWSDHARVQSLFEEFDQDGNGYVDIDEFQNLAFALGLTLNAQQCTAVIARIDKDGDGLVDLSEFKSWLHAPANVEDVEETEEGQLEALLLKTKLRARFLMRELRTKASGILPVTTTIRKKSKEPIVHVGAPLDNNLVRRKTIRLNNNKALYAVPTDVLQAEVAKRKERGEAQ